TKDLKISDVVNALDEELGPHFFPAKEGGTDPRVCPACGNGRLGLKLGRYGSFIGCSNFPECQFTRRLAIENGEGEGETLKDGIRVLGKNPETNEDITVRRGPWGLYVQQGEPDPNDKKAKPKRTTLPRNLDGETITLEQALGLLSLPRLVGLHPETKLPIEANLGRFGPYVKMGAIFGSLDKDDDILSVGLNRAVDVLARKMASQRNIGPHPKGGETVQVRKGRFGPYVQHGQTVANLPKNVSMDDITLDEAVALLAEKGKQLKPKGRGAKAKAAKPEAPKKAAAKPKKAAKKKD
ncbi:MAG TPA: topoisomerase C-terminal repeat-containing protein, partial [Acetobacteraceae bacterium]|nr:topoisomerase C-terminal repeat-containing protein [Acetobacteraceae bacterium]